MHETYVTIQGNVATPLRHGFSRQGTPFASFRLACTLRRNLGEGWQDIATSFYQVSCYRALADNAVASLQVGQPVVVYGRQLVKQWANGDKRGTDVEIDAVSIGHDMTCGTSMFSSRSRRLSAVPAPPVPAQQVAAQPQPADPARAVEPAEPAALSAPGDPVARAADASAGGPDAGPHAPPQSAEQPAGAA